MDFKKLKDEALKLKNKAVEVGKDAVEFSAGKLADSSLTLKTTQDLEKFIEKSSTTTGKDSSTGKEKKFKHQVIIIFVDLKSDFFKELLYKLPVLSTKAFSQNIALKAADINMKDIDSKKYKIGKQETLAVFQDKEVIKTLEGEEMIQKVVKSLSLDINKSIEEL
ncbi:hypothetical protein LR010_02400 [Candidatus Gracilibacteria bacterium]|nr:hypothetical protein [Candidatus Gracilibacteria bacterium]